MQRDCTCTISSSTQRHFASEEDPILGLGWVYYPTIRDVYAISISAFSLCRTSMFILDCFLC